MHAAYNGGRLGSYLLLGASAGAVGRALKRRRGACGFPAQCCRRRRNADGDLGGYSTLVAKGVRVHVLDAPDGWRHAMGSILVRFKAQPPVIRAAAMGLTTTLLPWWLVVRVRRHGLRERICSGRRARDVGLLARHAAHDARNGLRCAARPRASRRVHAGAQWGRRHDPRSPVHCGPARCDVDAHDVRDADAMTPAITAIGTACAHCGLSVPAAFIRASDVEQFCCQGCRVASEFLSEHGLAGYKAFRDKRGAPVSSTGRSYDEFDHPAFAELYVRTREHGLRTTELYLEGVHCASCVWVVERVPLLIPGVVRAELDVAVRLPVSSGMRTSFRCRASRAHSTGSATHRILFAVLHGTRSGGARIARRSRGSGSPVRSPAM